MELCGFRSLTTRGGAALLLGDRLGASAFRLLDSQTKTQREKKSAYVAEMCLYAETHKLSIYRTEDWSPESRIFKSHRFNPYGCSNHICSNVLS